MQRKTVVERAEKGGNHSFDVRNVVIRFLMDRNGRRRVGPQHNLSAQENYECTVMGCGKACRLQSRRHSIVSHFTGQEYLLIIFIRHN